MVTALLFRAGALPRAAGRLLYRAVKRRMVRRAVFDMLHLDERMLHDIGLSRADVIACLSSPHEDAADFFEQRRVSRRASDVSRADAARYRIAA
jgi:uncharacterized protein YjiS (DUF1127 family)